MMNNICFPQKVKIKKDVLIQDIGGESVLLDLSSECYFGLEEVGTTMLKTLNESDSIKNAYDRLILAYDTNPEQLQKDLFELIEKLEGHGLVQITGP